MNPCENLGAIVRERAEELLLKESDRNSSDTLVRVLKCALKSIENDRALFVRLLKSFRHRLDLVKEANGKSIKKY